MRLTLIPTFCLMCNFGRVKNRVCVNCKARYGNTRVKKKKNVNHTPLPKVHEINPNRISKEYRNKVTSRSNRDR